MRAPFYLLNLNALPILEQLYLEEALLRLTTENWLLVNSGTEPAIVMGISGKSDSQVNSAMLEEKPIPLIKRYSGGGTVVVDKDTLFYSIIARRDLLGAELSPTKILHWSADLYKPAFGSADFSLRENDYTIGSHKCGGNALYIAKERWLHHCTLLWDYDEAMMQYLLMPSKMPQYREKRSHGAFLCRLNTHFPTIGDLQQKMLISVASRYPIIETPLSSVLPLLQKPHRRSTTLLQSCCSG